MKNDSPFRIGSGRWQRALSPITRLAEVLLGLKQLDAKYDSLGHLTDVDEFLDRALEMLGVELDMPGGELERVPASGPTIVVANHPFGGIDGMLLTSLLRRVRPDVRVLANQVLARIEPLRESIIGVDPFDNPTSLGSNARSMREALRWVRGGGLLLVFPAGEVAHRRWRRLSVSDPEWQSHIARLVQRTGASVTPIFVGGHNSAAFQLAGLLHPRLRTLMLPRELLSGSRRVPVRVGHVITPNRLAWQDDPRELTDYLRLRTEILSRRVDRKVASRVERVLEPLAGPIPRHALTREIAALPPASLLVESRKCRVHLVTAEQAPHALLEIGRLREEAFRAVGEGTGRARDIDAFDNTYHHLIAWDPVGERILGAYRLGLTDRIAGGEGAGLYSSTLFRFGPDFLRRVMPGIELGRSFVRIECQRDSLTLLMLWRGIGAFVAANPQYHMLFGPVSISAEYDPTSLALMVDHLRECEGLPDIARDVRPRNPVSARRLRRGSFAWSPGMLTDLDQVSAMISEIERDHKGVPVLLREYLKLGGKILAFNVDPDFADAIDGLVLVDLRDTPIRLLNRYLGEEAASRLLDAGRSKQNLELSAWSSE